MRGFIPHPSEVVYARRLKASNDRKQARYEAAQARIAAKAAAAIARLNKPKRVRVRTRKLLDLKEEADALAAELIAKALRRG